jgi:hypothetical protein
MTCSVSHWSGRLGNNIQQVANCIMFAEKNGDKFDQKLEHNTINKFTLNFGLQENFTFDELNTNYKKCLYNIVYLQIELGTNLSEDRKFPLQELHFKIIQINKVNAIIFFNI